MKFPNQAIVRRNAANPPEHLAGSVDSETADLVGCERCEHLLPRGVEILPVLSSVSEGVAKKDGRLLDSIRGVQRQVDDPTDHLFQFGWDSPAAALYAPPAANLG